MNRLVMLLIVALVAGPVLAGTMNNVDFYQGVNNLNTADILDDVVYNDLMMSYDPTSFQILVCKPGGNIDQKYYNFTSSTWVRNNDIAGNDVYVAVSSDGDDNNSTSLNKVYYAAKQNGNIDEFKLGVGLLQSNIASSTAYVDIVAYRTTNENNLYAIKPGGNIDRLYSAQGGGNTFTTVSDIAANIQYTAVGADNETAHRFFAAKANGDIDFYHRYDSGLSQGDLVEFMGGPADVIYTDLVAFYTTSKFNCYATKADGNVDLISYSFAGTGDYTDPDNWTLTQDVADELIYGAIGADDGTGPRFVTSKVPEPATLGLLTLGGIVMAIRRKR